MTGGSVQPYEFATATRILFGRGAVCRIDNLASSVGERFLAVTGACRERAAPILDVIAGRIAAAYSVDREPSLDTADAGTLVARSHRCDAVVCVGGGSALDTAKAIALLLTNGGHAIEYVEVIGQGRRPTAKAAPLIAIPTTSGTGAEVTRNSVLSSTEHRRKVSLRSPLMLPAVAVVDPALTDNLPPEVTAYTGMDALTQVMEAYVSRRWNPLVDAICLDGVERVAASLRRAYDSGDCPAARDAMALASLFGGLALSNAGLGAVHGLAGSMGGMYDIPHGLICGRLLAPAMAANVHALESRSPADSALRRYAEITRALTGSVDATPVDAVAWISELAEHMRLPRLGDYGLTRKAIGEVVTASRAGSSMAANPIELTTAELTDIVEAAL